jgi:four helix bundle protein
MEYNHKFRFQDLEIWQQSISIIDDILDIADNLEKNHKYRFAEQLRGSVLSISNNIAEGSGSISKKDFSNFLNIARRSCFETANILLVVERRSYIDKQQLNNLLSKLDYMSRRITNFQKALKRI